MNTMSMQVIDGTPVWGKPDLEALSQIRTCAKNAVATALMADHHVGYAIPIGGVVAYKDAISPSGVGYDIACGNKAVRLDIPADEVRKNIKTIMDSIYEELSFGIGQSNSVRVDHELFDDPVWKLHAVAPLKELARNQLGTIGSGNHFVDVFTDELDRVWVGIHCGSRGFGHHIATWFLNAGGAADGMHVEPLVLPVTSALGAEYLECMKLAGRYAYAGRDWICNKAAKLLGATIEEEVHNHHNYAWQEAHEGIGDVWVIRKGATPAFPGQQGFVGGSMGDVSVIIEGVEHSDSPAALYSTVHGAGRVMGRMEAKGKWKKNHCHRPGKVTQEMMRSWIDEIGVELRGADVDESPHCYKRLLEVLAAHKGSIKILHTLWPLGVAMASGHKYKD